ncbi:MAG: protein kinase [Caldilineaceae bacterium]|nr:protein kinase [Caldilineaceae bacterium]
MLFIDDDRQTPARQLVGRELPNGWKVEEAVERPLNATGGNFSASYIVRGPDGRKAFLKAMDYMKALGDKDPATALEIMTTAFNFERSLLEKCRSRKLSRIVRVLDGGTLPAQDGDLSSVVQYLVFELASGDIRSIIDIGQTFEFAWTLRIMHQTAAALQQLHSVRIAHQDVKPSNILLYENDRYKLADLGRAFDLNQSSPHDELPCAGDRTYAPPELLYGQIHEDWTIRRLGCDMYLLGSIFVFLCRGVSLTHLLLKRLDVIHHPNNWSGLYGEVLTHVESEFAQMLREFREAIPSVFSEEAANLVSQLCNPDPQRRGHPLNSRSGNRYSLERYVSIFDRLAKKAEWSLRRGKPIHRVN